MNKTARHVFRLCVTARNLRRIPRNTTWTCYFQTASLPYSSNSNTDTKDNRLALTSSFESTDNEKISELILTSNTAEDIFKVVRENRPFLKRQHCLEALEMLDGMYRQKNKTDLSIAKRMEFLQLCEVLANQIQSLNANHAVRTLKIISHLGVPLTSIISQSLLQVIKTSLGHLSFHYLLSLEHQLRDCKSTPLTDALKIAIPIMCQIQLNNKMLETTNANELADVLLFLRITPGNHNKSIEMVINALLIIGQHMIASHARKILVHLCELKYLPPGYEEVLLNVQQVLTRNIMRLRFHDIQMILRKVAIKVSYHGDKAFYNEEFVDACAKAVVSEDFGFEEGVLILKSLHTLGYTQIRLIDYLAAKCFENPQVLNECSQSSIMSLMIGFAGPDYKPIFWESMQENILKNIAKKQYSTKPILLDFVISMAVFDCFNSELIKIAFSESFLQTLFLRNNPRYYWNLLLLYQSIKLLYPNYDGSWPPEYMLQTAIKANGPSVEKSSLLPVLEKAMGGSQYVLSNLKSKLGHHIDHVVIMRKGGYPVAVNSLSTAPEEESILYIEDIQLPTESQVIIVINLPANAYSINSHRLKGHWTLLLKTLEIQSKHTVIPISSIMWNALTDHEKIPYLMQAIRLKCDNLSASANI